MTPEEAQGLDYADSSDVADTLKMLRSLRTEWTVARETPYGFEFWVPAYKGWFYGEGEAAWFPTRASAVSFARYHGLQDYQLANRLIGPVEVVE
jgi:hypothetical protein